MKKFLFHPFLCVWLGYCLCFALEFIWTKVLTWNFSAVGFNPYWFIHFSPIKDPRPPFFNWFCFPWSMTTILFATPYIVGLELSGKIFFPKIRIKWPACKRTKEAFSLQKSFWLKSAIFQNYKISFSLCHRQSINTEKHIYSQNRTINP